MDEDTIGTRLRILRRWRGMTQETLAGLAGLPRTYISMVEHGRRTLDRRSQIAALATALRVSETDLVGGPPHLSADPQQSGPHASIPVLRTALLTNSLSCPAVGYTRPITELGTEVSALDTLYRRCDYLTVGQRLPGVLDELHAHASPDEGEANRMAALEALVEACITAAFMAKDLGYPDLAHVAALRAEEAARTLGEPATLGKAAFLRFHTVPRSLESWERTLGIAERAADELEPHAGDAKAVPVLGLLTLSAALAGAVLQRSPVVEHWLTESTALATRVPDEMDAHWQSFCTTNVVVWRTSLAVERGESGGKVAELAEAVDEHKLTSRSRRADFLVDVGRGVARDPQAQAAAVRWLRRAEDVGPQRVRNSMTARETVTYLLGSAKASAGGRELRGIAARMGIPH